MSCSNDHRDNGFHGNASSPGGLAGCSPRNDPAARFAEEVGIDDYTLIDVLGGYREYRSMMDTYTQQQAEKLTALNAAIANNETDAVISGLTQQLMTLDMDILRLKQSTLDQAASLMDSQGHRQTVHDDP